MALQDAKKAQNAALGLGQPGEWTSAEGMLTGDATGHHNLPKWDVDIPPALMEKMIAHVRTCLGWWGRILKEIERHPRWVEGLEVKAYRDKIGLKCFWLGLGAPCIVRRCFGFWAR